jgi:Response regulator containing a CheY-like receiver domain and an HTH DNA-binding domain
MTASAFTSRDADGRMPVLPSHLKEGSTGSGGFAMSLSVMSYSESPYMNPLASSQTSKRTVTMSAADNRIRILLVDDHPMLREGIAAVLGTEPDMALVAEASNGREAIEQFRAHRPDITFMDLQMPVMNGTDAILAIRKEFPDARIIVLTTYSGDAQAGRAFRAGAWGYLLKNMVRKELIETVRCVHNGKKKIPPEIAVEMAEHHMDDALTDREIEVLQQVAAGNANKIVAINLCVSEETVKTHMRSIMSKLGANDRTHAVTIGLKRGIIDIEAVSSLRQDTHWS